MSFILVRNKEKQDLLSKINEIKYVNFVGFKIDNYTNLYIDDLQSNIDKNANNNTYTIGHAFYENDTLLREFGVYAMRKGTTEKIAG